METKLKPICIIEVNENLRRVKLGEELTRPLKELNFNCEFKRKYQEFCDIQDGIEPFIAKTLVCPYCKCKFKQKKVTQNICSKIECRNKKSKEYYEKNKDKINKRRMERYYLNKKSKQ